MPATNAVLDLAASLVNRPAVLFLDEPTTGLDPARRGETWTPLRAAAAFGCLIVVAVTTYCFALMLAALVLAVTELRNVVANVAQLMMMLICGVMMPVAFWPGWVQAVAQALPLTHGLAAVRTLADSSADPMAPAAVLVPLLVAAGIGVGWLVLAAGLLERFAAAGRRSGTIEFAD